MKPSAPGREERDGVFQQLLAAYGQPAYVRRARGVQDALEKVLAQCRQRRDEWLLMPRIHLGVLRGLAGGRWEPLAPLLMPGEAAVLEELHRLLEPRPRLPITPSDSLRKLAKALATLCEGLERFNARWLEFVPTVDLKRLNELREAYNRWYVLEKECAVRSVTTARAGFVPLEPMTPEGLLALLPPLPVPQQRFKKG